MDLDQVNAVGTHVGGEEPLVVGADEQRACGFSSAGDVSGEGKGSIGLDAECDDGVFASVASIEVSAIVVDLYIGSSTAFT